jgi:hypothetical protein
VGDHEQPPAVVAGVLLSASHFAFSELDLAAVSGGGFDLVHPVASAEGNCEVVSKPVVA